MRICVWNVRGATENRHDVWDYLLEINADLVLLQEIGSIPETIHLIYDSLHRKAVRKNGQPQQFSTGILVKGSINDQRNLTSSLDWVNQELERFHGNMVAADITLSSGKRLRVMSVYSPAWPIDRTRLDGIDTTGIKLTLNQDVWVTEIMWAALTNEDLDTIPWVVGGDLNSSVTFDYLWSDGPRGNQEIQDRMSALGFVECLLHAQGKLTPTFKNPHGGKVIHQMDYLYVPESMKSGILSCNTGDTARVFDGLLSDHLPIIAECE